MAVLNPVKLVIDNYPEDQIEMLEVQNNLENPELGSRQVPFGRELYIEREDFMEEPVRKYFRMFPGNEVRLMNAYFVTCTGCEKDENGNITVIHGTYDPESKGGNSPDGRKVKGTIHWVAAKTAVKAECRLYENLIDEEKGVYNEDGSMNLNPNSLTVLKECYLEPSLKDAKAYDSFQFVRNGFFCVDAKRFQRGCAGVQPYRIPEELFQAAGSEINKNFEMEQSSRLDETDIPSGCSFFVREMEDE